METQRYGTNGNAQVNSAATCYEDLQYKVDFDYFVKENGFQRLFCNICKHTVLSGLKISKSVFRLEDLLTTLRGK